MSVESIVRTAIPADRTEIWRLFLNSHRENGIFSLSPTKVDWFLTRVLIPESIPEWDTGVRGTIGVIGEVGALEGIVFVTIGSFWYTEDRHLEEFCVYVDPEHRKSGHAKALISWMKQQSEDTGLRLITGIMSNVRTEAKVRLYERMMPKIGAFFMWPKDDGVAVTGYSS